MNPISAIARRPHLHGTPGPRPSEAATSPVATDSVSLSAAPETEAERKERLLRGMIRSRDPQMATDAATLLSRYPLEAIERVAAFGTRIEFYQPDEALPDDLAELRTPGYLGGYNPITNVIGILAPNANTFTVLHEFAHALDASMQEVSATPAWERSFEQARADNRSVRDNARKNAAEYLADDVAAWLIPDSWLPPLVAAAAASPNPDIARDRQDYSHDRLRRKDPQGWLLAEMLLTREVREAAPAPPRPAPAR